MFISTIEGQIINLDHIVTIERRNATRPDLGHHYLCHCSLSNGEHINGHIPKADVEALACDAIWDRVIPAAPGFFVLNYEYAPEAGEQVDKEPIVAWRFTRNWECPAPVTVLGIDGQGAEILHPDGRVVSPGLSSTPNFEMWLAEKRERHLPKRPSLAEIYPGDANI